MEAIPEGSAQDVLEGFDLAAVLRQGGETCGDQQVPEQFESADT